MRGLGKSLRAIFTKLADFFDIFDLSFIVSGALSLAALLLWYRLAGQHFLDELLHERRGSRLAAVLLGCYTLGLISFTVGRFLRMALSFGRSRSWTSHFHEALSSHRLGELEEIRPYLTDWPRRAQGLYIFLWAKMRQSRRLAPSLIFLNRYWVMAATYDGVAVSLLIWGAVMACWACGVGLPAAGGRGPLVAGTLLLLAALACFREARRYASSQIEELCATMAWDRTQSLPQQGPPVPEDHQAAAP